jgi:hypothetical protein
MHHRNHDAIVEIDCCLARVQALSPEARNWIEAHVTLAQVQTWTGNILEVTPHCIGELITGMFADGLHLSTARDQVIKCRTHCGSDLFMTYMSQN